MGKTYRLYGKTTKRPRRPWEKARLDKELKLCGEYGLRNKREVHRVGFVLSKVRAVARTLLTLPEKDPKRMFEGAALLRRLTRLGLISETEQKLDYVLSLTIEKFLDRRLQTRVFASGLALSIHHARCLIRQRHIRVGKTMVDNPSFNVRLESEKVIEFSHTSPYGAGRPGRKKRKSLKTQKEKKAESGGAAADEEDM